MPPARVACPKCRTPWPAELAPLAALRFCPGCQRAAAVHIFPALIRPAAPVAHPEKLLIEGEASCFYHTDKRAVIPCGACGRFLCALCDVTLGEKHLCPNCIEAGRAKGRFTEFETSRALWDNSALILALVAIPMVICAGATVVLAPAAIVVALIGWRKPSSIIRRMRWRLWLALALATLEIAACVVVIVMLATGQLQSLFQ